MKIYISPTDRLVTRLFHGEQLDAVERQCLADRMLATWVTERGVRTFQLTALGRRRFANLQQRLGAHER